MIQEIQNFILKKAKNVLNSIAFYSSVVALSYMVLAIVVRNVEYLEMVKGYKKTLGIDFVNSEENARLILGGLVGGIISLMVFSFSMVMVVINRTMATLSPRVVPGIITKKSHQIVLGYYIGTIVFCLITITGVGEEFDGKAVIPDLGVLIALFSGIGCLVMFVYFIHSISQSIQVDNILNGIYRTTLNGMQKAKEGEKLPESVFKHEKEDEEWVRVYAAQVGYLKKVHTKALCDLLDEHDLKLSVLIRMGDFTVKGFPFVKVNRSLEEDESLQDKIQSSFEFYQEEFTQDHYRFGFRQITEIAVKALSPGINDPGTAVKAIDLLTILFIERLSLFDFTVTKGKEDVPRLFVREPTFGELLYECITPIRKYGREDTLVMATILKLLEDLTIVSINKAKQEEILELEKLAKSVSSEADRYLINQLDRAKINEYLSNIERLLQNQNGNKSFSIQLEVETDD
ncbi:DUF2254 domain-containing protein [Limibacter armeniacum]|uniref:DUF2254 domain-containing protein n=1 Tax=Limibacter armeniacum TaxID=466084 RepID=UPI002FE5EF07